MKTSVHFEKCNVQSAELHNTRDPKYLEMVEKSDKKFYDIFHDRTPLNSHWKNPVYQDIKLTELLDEMRERYRKHVGQKPQELDREYMLRGVMRKKPGWSPIRESVGPVKEDTTIEDFMPFVEWLESKGVSVISIDIHLDEGHVKDGQRHYNRHAHIICDWTDPQTGKTRKLDPQDMSILQDKMADALGMKRGEPSNVKHLSALQFRILKASEQLSELLLKIEEAAAREELTEAKKKEFIGSMYDVAARFGKILGKGTIAKAQSEAKDANARAEVAEQAREVAEQACETAKQSEAKAKNEKDKYGQEMYRKGLSDGRRQGSRSRDNEVNNLEVQLNSLKEQLSALQHNIKNQLEHKDYEHQQEIENLIAKHEETTLALKKFEDQVLKIFPNLENIETNWLELKKAGLTPEERKTLLIESSLETTLHVSQMGKKYKVSTTVEMGRSNSGVMRVWFNKKTLRRFLDDVLGKIKKTINNPKM